MWSCLGSAYLEETKRECIYSQLLSSLVKGYPKDYQFTYIPRLSLCECQVPNQDLHKLIEACIGVVADKRIYSVARETSNIHLLPGFKSTLPRPLPITASSTVCLLDHKPFTWAPATCGPFFHRFMSLCQSGHACFKVCVPEILGLLCASVSPPVQRWLYYPRSTNSDGKKDRMGKSWLKQARFVSKWSLSEIVFFPQRHTLLGC